MPLPAAKPRALLAVLLLSRNRVVSTGELIDDLWGEVAPETATKALQGYVSQLRKAIGADRVLTKPPGYSLHVEDGELDLDGFERLVREGRERLAAGDAEAASQRLEEALALWRGRPFTEFDREPFARDAGARLEEERLAALDDRIEADLALGRHAELVSELEELVGREPFRERPRAQLMLALYRSGRQADALDLYRRTRETFVEELGIEPGEELQELERAILRHDADLELPRRAARATPRPDEKTQEPARKLGRRWLLVPATILVAVAVAAALAVAGRDSSGEADAELRPFVRKLENILAQSRDGRQEASAAVGGAVACTLAPRAAVVRLNRVQRNRQSLLQQVAALSVPEQDEAVRAADLLQQAIQASIAADWRYRDWLVARKRCARDDEDPDLTAARAADAHATSAKRAFAAAFNPLARRLDQRVWSASEF